MSNEIINGIKKGKDLAETLKQRWAKVQKAEKRHENALYRYFEELCSLEPQARKMKKDELLKFVESNYGVTKNKSKKLFSFLIELTYPDLTPRQRSKYATALKYVMAKKKRGSVRKFMKKRGGINGCARVP